MMMPTAKTTGRHLMRRGARPSLDGVRRRGRRGARGAPGRCSRPSPPSRRRSARSRSRRGSSGCPRARAAFMAMNANSIDSGIAEATISPPRRSPSSSSSTTMTSAPPSTGSSRPSDRAPTSGAVVEGVDRDARRAASSEISAIFSLTRSTTVREFSPISIITMPTTASPRPSRVTAPWRIIGASSTAADVGDRDRRPRRAWRETTDTPRSSSAASSNPRRGSGTARPGARCSRRRRCGCSPEGVEDVADGQAVRGQALGSSVTW
jgi:hypothetical protein